MKLFKAIKSAIESVGLFTIISWLYGVEELSMKDFILVGILSIIIVIIENKAFRWSADHFEIEECPYCGAELEYIEDEV